MKRVPATARGSGPPTGGSSRGRRRRTARRRCRARDVSRRCQPRRRSHSPVLERPGADAAADRDGGERWAWGCGHGSSMAVADETSRLEHGRVDRLTGPLVVHRRSRRREPRRCSCTAAKALTSHSTVPMRRRTPARTSGHGSAADGDVLAGGTGDAAGGPRQRRGRRSPRCSTGTAPATAGRGGSASPGDRRPRPRQPTSTCVDGQLRHATAGDAELVDRDRWPGAATDRRRAAPGRPPATPPRRAGGPRDRSTSPRRLGHSGSSDRCIAADRRAGPR